MATPRIVFEPDPSADTRHWVELGVDLHNVAATQRADAYPLAFTLRDADGALLGGVLGEVWAGWLHITNLWVSEPLRHRGWAHKLVRAAERFAVARGAHDAYLETFSFQARPLYEQLGYAVFATLEDCPPGHAKYFLRKRLSADRGPSTRRSRTARR